MVRDANESCTLDTAERFSCRSVALIKETRHVEYSSLKLPGCAILVDEVTVSELVENETVRQKYQYLIAKAFVAGNKHIQWCPAPGCENAVKVDLAVAKPIHCECGTLYWCVLIRCGERLFLIHRLRNCLTRFL
jgi:hypothetical protein